MIQRKSFTPEEIKEISRKLDSHYIRAWCQEWEFDTDTTGRMLGYYAACDDPFEVIRYIAAVTTAEIFGRMNAKRMIPADLFRFGPATFETDITSPSDEFE